MPFRSQFCNSDRRFGTHGTIPNKSKHANLPCIVQLQQLIPQTSPRCFSLTTTIRISRARALLKLVLHASLQNFSRPQRISKSFNVFLSLSLSFSAFPFLASHSGWVLRQHLKRRGCSGDWRAPAAPTGSQHFGVHCARVHGVEAQPYSSRKHKLRRPIRTGYGMLGAER